MLQRDHAVVVHRVHVVHVPGADVVPLADVPLLEDRARGQDDVRVRRLAFLPDRLVDDELEAWVLVGANPAIPVDHGAEELAAVLVEHPHRHVSRRRVEEGEELPLHRRHVGDMARGLARGDRLGEPDPWDALPHRVHGHDVRHALVVVGRIRPEGQLAREGALAVAREIETEVEGRAELQIAEVDARAAPALHRAENGHHPGPLHARRGAAGAAHAHSPAARAEVGLLASPLARQGADVACRHPGFFLLPLGRFGLAVALAQNIGLPLLEPGGPLRHEILVVEPLGDPYVTDRLRERGVASRLRRDPLAADVGRGVVQVRIDVHHLDAELPGPLAPLGPFEPVGGVRV